MIRHLNENNFNEVLTKEGVTLVDFYASWCGPCKKVSEELDKIENSRANLYIVKIDIDDSMNLALKYNVMYLPTLVVIKNGEAVEVVTGYKDASEIVSLIEKHN